MSKAISQARFTCALGAQNTVLAIPKAIPIVHGGPGCSATVNQFSQMANLGECYAGGSHVPSTNTDESHVVFGGERKLKAEIEGALKIMKGDLFVLLSGCTAGIIGDNVASVASEFADQNLPVVGAETSGFKGTAYTGHELVIKAIIDQFVGNVKPSVQKGLVNVFADVPAQNPFWRGDLEQLKILLEKIGLKVNILLGVTSAGVSEWKDIPNAQFNLLVSPWVGLDTVEFLKRKYGTPYLHYPVLPIGGNESSKFLREVASFAGLDKEIVEDVIACEEKVFYDYFIGTADFFAELQDNLPQELYISGDSLSTFGIAKFLEEEVGYNIKGLFITDNPNEKNESKLREIFKTEFTDYDESKVLYFEPDSEKIREITEPQLKKSNRALVLGSDWEKEYVKQSGNTFLYSSAPIKQQLIISKSYVGYQGGLNLLEDIYNSIFAVTSLVIQLHEKKLA